VQLRVDSGAATPGGDELLIPRGTAAAWGWKVGSTVAGEYPDGTRASLRIAGIYADNRLTADRPYIMSPASYRPHAPGDLIHFADVDTEDGPRARRSEEAPGRGGRQAVLRRAGRPSRCPPSASGWPP
jgi:hypothetical protein